MLRSGPLSFTSENGLPMFSCGANLKLTSNPPSFKRERPLRTFTRWPKLRFTSGALTLNLGKPLRIRAFCPNLNLTSGPLNLKSDKPLLSWTFLGPSRLKSGALIFTFWPPLSLILRKPVLRGLLFLGGWRWAWPWPNPCPWPCFLCATGRVLPCSDFFWIPLKNLPCKGLWKVDLISCCSCAVVGPVHWVQCTATVPAVGLLPVQNRPRSPADWFRSQWQTWD